MRSRAGWRIDCGCRSSISSLVLEDRAGLAGEELRIRFGEARLKTLESELVDEVALYRGTVIHVSGKTLMQSCITPA